MERTVTTLALLLVVTGTAVAEPQFLFNVLRGNQGGRPSSLLGNIINSTAGVLLKPLSFLGGGGHAGGGNNGETSAPESGHGGGIKPPFGQPNSDASTYRPTSQGVLFGGGHEQTGDGSSVNHGAGHAEEGPGDGFNNGIGGQTSGTTQNSVDSAIDEIFGNRGGGGTTAGQGQGSTPSSTRGPASDHAVGGTTTVGKGQEESTSSDVDLAIQQIFGGGSHGGVTGKVTSTENPSSAGSSNPRSGETQNGEHKLSTSSPVNSAIQDVFGNTNKENEASSKKTSNDTDLDSGGKDGTSSPVESAILDVFGKGHDAVEEMGADS